MQAETTTIIVLVFLLAGAVKGMIGLGLPTIAMGLLTLAMPPSAAASLLLVPSFITNVWHRLGRPVAAASRFGQSGHLTRHSPTILVIRFTRASAAIQSSASERKPSRQPSIMDFSSHLVQRPPMPATAAGVCSSARIARRKG
ncbi:hypothetical protein WK69_09105 [Burkholderia ubonensis]|nr:hypothetical protein WK69_09105 [Burkholderia ubonensis]